jgi:DNA-binding transcriptional LysR family regulator
MQVMTAKTQLLNWNDLQLLLAFGEASSLLTAAQKLKLDATTLSRRLRSLEKKLGQPILVHEGRNLRLTGVGELAMAAAQSMDHAANDMLLKLTAAEADTTGIVRLTALRSILRHIVLPAVPKLNKKHPNIALDLIDDQRNLAIGRREADLAIRLARPTGTDIATRKLLDIPFVVAGDPAAGWITYNEKQNALPEAKWISKNVPSKKIAMHANSMELIADAVRQKLGQAILPKFLCGGLPHGDVVLTREAWLVMHTETRQTPRIRAVADWIIAEAKL